MNEKTEFQQRKRRFRLPPPVCELRTQRLGTFPAQRDPHKQCHRSGTCSVPNRRRPLLDHGERRRHYHHRQHCTVLCIFVHTARTKSRCGGVKKYDATDNRRTPWRPHFMSPTPLVLIGRYLAAVFFLLNAE